MGLAFGSSLIVVSCLGKITVDFFSFKNRNPISFSPLYTKIGTSMGI